MGMLSNIFNRSSPTTTAGEYVPSSNQLQTMRDRLATGSTAVVDKATQIYKKNPKLVGGLAVLAAAGVLAGLKRRGTF